MVLLPKFAYPLLALFTLSAALQLPVNASVTTFGTGSNQFEMTFVEIGNPGNVDDTTGDPNPAGSVEYAYQLGKYEVSEDMIDKFNASQSLTISHNERGANKPATSVSWNEAARFVNWLNTSQGHQAAYNFTSNGVNDDIALWSSEEAWQLGGENLFRHKDAYYFLPSMDEWYKAAYYNPSTGEYGDYPSLDGNEPSAVSSGTADNTAVYDQSYGQGPADITSAGGLSAYGIMGMGGNAWEWQETSDDLSNSAGSIYRGVRGGYWGVSSGDLSSSVRSIDGPGDEFDSVGFRVASLSSPDPVPEPGAFAVWAVLSGIGLCWLKRRARK